HPCICAGFNADFDGDQMAVHIPLSQKAQDEAKTLMMAKMNILKPADGSPITLPNKEMAFGVFSITSINHHLEPIDKIFIPEEAIHAFQSGNIGLKQIIKVKIGEEILETTTGR